MGRLPTGLQLSRQLIRELIPGAKVSGGLEGVPLGRDNKPDIFSIRWKGKYVTFILDDGVTLRKIGDAGAKKRTFDLRIPNIIVELKAYLKEAFDNPNTPSDVSST